MVATVTPISPTLLGYRANDKPLIIPRNKLQDSAATFPRAVSNAFFNIPDESNPLYPITNLFDGTRRTQWRTLNAVNDIFIVTDFGASTTLSAFVIEGDDDTLAGRRFRVRCSDALAGTGRLQAPIRTPVPLTVLVNGRNVFLPSDEVRARYWEVTFDNNGQPAIVYKLRQFWMGEQVQLPFKSRVPYDERQQWSDFVDVIAKSGDRTRIAYVTGLARRDVNFWLRDSTIVSALRTAFEDSEGWAQKIWYIEDPGTAPKATAVFGDMAKPGLDLPSQIEDDRLWKNSVIESGPHLD